uniref:(Fe-S)-binding protein n=1 Tax=Thermofilum pendens TaxID=2269 RepID=A0A7C1T6M2_THEPE
MSAWEEFSIDAVKAGARDAAGRLNSVLLHFVENCVSCALCEINCPYTPAGEEYGPVEKAEPLRKILRSQVFLAAKILPLLFGARLPRSAEEINKWAELAYRCTNCGLCYTTCPFGIHSGTMIQHLRYFLAKTGRVPTLLKMMMELETSGNILSAEGFSRVWSELLEKLRGLGVTFDRKGAKYVYLPSLAEALITPGAVIGTARILNKLGLDWTMPDKPLSIRAPIASLVGDSEAALEVTKRMIDYVAGIGASAVILSDGGYPYRFLRFDAPALLAKPLGFDVVHVVELLHEALKKGALKLKGADQKVTWHSPCQLGRMGGLVEEPAEVLSAASKNFVELESHGFFSKCCGGGNGVACVITPTVEMFEGLLGTRIPISEKEKVFMDKLYKDMLIASKAKVDEIKKSGASVVVTACVGCVHTLHLASKAYGLGVEIKTLPEFIAELLPE